VADLVKEIYGELFRGTDRVELELHPRELRSGMVLARDVRSGTGLMLLSRGTSLDETQIFALQRYYQIDPFKKGVSVLVKR